MGNRFYISPRSTVSEDMGRLGGLALQLYGLKQRGDIATAQQKLSERELGMRGEQIKLEGQAQRAEYGSVGEYGEVIPGLKQQEMGLRERGMNVAEETQGMAKEKADLDKKANMDLANFGTPKAHYTANKLKALGIPEKHPLLEQINTWGSDPDVTNAEAYQRLKNDYPAYRGQLAKLIMDDHSKKEEKDPLYAKTPQGIAQIQMVEALDKDKTGDEVIGREFAGTVAAMKRRQGEKSAVPPKPDWNTIKDPKSSTGYSYQNMNNPAEIRPGAPAPKESAQPEILQLIGAYNQMPPGDQKTMLMARINKLTETSGLQVRVNKDGSVELLQGPGAAKASLSAKTTGDIEEKLLGGKEQLARLQSISEEFKPEYLETGTRLKASWTGIKAKLGQNVSPQDSKDLTEFKKFQRKAIENINKYIKEITGAQMSEKEADRIRLAQPDPGEKWYQGDDPITFKAKLDDSIKSTRAAVARYEYYRAKGLGDSEIAGLITSNKAISLDDIMKRMQ